MNPSDYQKRPVHTLTLLGGLKVEDPFQRYREPKSHLTCGRTDDGKRIPIPVVWVERGILIHNTFVPDGHFTVELGPIPPPPKPKPAPEPTPERETKEAPRAPARKRRRKK